MALSLSQGTRDSMLVTSSFKGSMDGGELRIFTGSAPASPDDPETGTLLATIIALEGDTLLDFDAALSGAGQIQKSTAQTWTANAVASGTAGYFRFVADPADTGLLSTTNKRMQGNIATTGSDLNMTNTVVAIGAPQTISIFKGNLLEQ